MKTLCVLLLALLLCTGCNIRYGGWYYEYSANRSHPELYGLQIKKSHVLQQAIPFFRDENGIMIFEVFDEKRRPDGVLEGGTVLRISGSRRGEHINIGSKYHLRGRIRSGRYSGSRFHIDNEGDITRLLKAES
jgi:hypothetical protein